MVAQTVKASAYNAGHLGSVPGWGRSPGEVTGNPFQYSCLENLMDRGAWRATVGGVTKSRAWLSDFSFTFIHYRRMIVQYLSCCIWLISLSVMFSRFIHVVAHGMVSFFFKAEWCSCCEKHMVVPQKLKTELLYEPQKYLKSWSWRDTSTLMFTAALFTRAKRWKHLKSMDGMDKENMVYTWLPCLSTITSSLFK